MQSALVKEIRGFVRTNPANRQEDGQVPYFDAPLIGVAAADDPLFRHYQQIIGPYHFTPKDFLPTAASVVCWVLPVTEATRVSNRRETRVPSRAWARTRDQGESFNVLLRRHLVTWFEQQGYQATAPQLSAQWQAVEDPGAGPSSNWSERHAAYAAGLGTFSLNDALITPKGIAHRLGSLITACKLEPNPRSCSDYQSNCLYFRSDSCGLCIDRCPVNAISPQGHDKRKCRAYVYGTVPETVAARYEVQATGCGLCQTKVPCEFRNPASGRISK
ncbi:MAG: epoxyqueuosine reductase [Desulfuromonadales bacterium]|nr:epoxyqueuosine reductase [Desulfuromonadales bacterium]